MITLAGARDRLRVAPAILRERLADVGYGLDAGDEGRITTLRGLLQAPFLAGRGDRATAGQPIVVSNA